MATDCIMDSTAALEGVLCTWNPPTRSVLLEQILPVIMDLSRLWAAILRAAASHDHVEGLVDVDVQR